MNNQHEWLSNFNDEINEKYPDFFQPSATIAETPTHVQAIRTGCWDVIGLLITMLQHGEQTERVFTWTEFRSHLIRCSGFFFLEISNATDKRLDPIVEEFRIWLQLHTPYSSVDCEISIKEEGGLHIRHWRKAFWLDD